MLADWVVPIVLFIPCAFTLQLSCAYKRNDIAFMVSNAFSGGLADNRISLALQTQIKLLFTVSQCILL